MPGTTDAYLPPTPTLTTVRIHYNAGYGNTIWVRGDTYPFWWDKGRAARWTPGDVWVWETERLSPGQTVQVKPLVNDYTWSVGNNYIITGGTTVDIYPVFRDPAATITRIRVHRDVGVGNSVYLRGDTAPLNWNGGVLTTWTEGNAWTWETTSIPDGQKFEFKALINDSQWSLGSNYTAVGGSTIDIYSIFNTGEVERNTETVRVYYNPGAGNTMSVRGSVAPLSWTSGQPMTWTPADIWTWETTGITEDTAFEFKPLINDTTLSLGNNFWGRGGMTVEIYPKF